MQLNVQQERRQPMLRGASSSRKSCCPSFLRDRARIFIISIVFACATIPLLVNFNLVESRAALVALITAFFWLTELLPLAASSFIPFVLFPLFGVLTSDEAAKAYFNDTQFLFIGSFLLAAALEKRQLHLRFALRSLLIFKSMNGLLLSFFLATFALSMWMQNTATAACLAPLAVSIIDRLDAAETIEEVDDTEPDDKAVNLDVIALDDGEDEDVDIGGTLLVDAAAVSDGKREHLRKRFATALLLGIAYASSLGGACTPIGTGPNLVFHSIYPQLYPNAPPISFGVWIGWALPLALIQILLLWAFFAFIYCRRGSSLLQIPLVSFQEQLQALGPMHKVDFVVLGHFFVMAVLWISRSGGWSSLFDNPRQVRDGSVAITVGLSLFALSNANGEKRERILGLKELQGINWPIVVLLGGGFCLAEGLKVSGSIEILASALSVLSSLPRLLLVALVTAAVTLTTELTSNVSTSSIVLPLFGALALGIGESPLLLMLPATIACSCAFMLPVATPPNAIVFASGRLQAQSMFKIGAAFNLVAIILITLFTIFLAPPIFSFTIGTPPEWSLNQ